MEVPYTYVQSVKSTSIRTWYVRVSPHRLLITTTYVEVLPYGILRTRGRKSTEYEVPLLRQYFSARIRACRGTPYSYSGLQLSENLTTYSLAQQNQPETLRKFECHHVYRTLYFRTRVFIPRRRHTGASSISTPTIIDTHPIEMAIDIAFDPYHMLKRSHKWQYHVEHVQPAWTPARARTATIV